MLPVGRKPVLNTGILIWAGDFAEVFRFYRGYALISEKPEHRGALVAGDSITQSEKQGHEPQSAYLEPGSPTRLSINTIRRNRRRRPIRNRRRNRLRCHLRRALHRFQLDNRNEAAKLSSLSGAASSGSPFWRTSSILEAKAAPTRQFNRRFPWRSRLLHGLSRPPLSRSRQE